MLRKYIEYIIPFLLILSLGLSACSSKETTLKGKYIYVIDGSGIYYNFVDSKNYTTNDLWTDLDVNDSGTGTYIIEDNKITAYVNGDEYTQREIGYIYKNYIGFWWEGDLPTEDNKTTKITLTFFDRDHLNYQFKEDKTYEYTIQSNNEVVYTEIGAYSISDDAIICTNEKNEEITFLNTSNGVFCISYIKE